MASDKQMSPCGALFDFLKKYGRIKHSEAAVLLLSGKPLADGKSALTRASEPTWLSRFIVNAPQETLQRAYFTDPGISSIKIASRLTAVHGTSASLDLADTRGKSMMSLALRPYGQAQTLFGNSYDRFRKAPGLSQCEHLEAVTVLLVSTAIYGNVREAVLYTLNYCRNVWGGITAFTPEAQAFMKEPTEGELAPNPLGLLKVVDGCCNGAMYWVHPDAEGCVLGSMALDEFDIADVGPHVSAQHARIWRSGGKWFVEDLHSTNGTKVVRAGKEYEVTSSLENNQFELKPGDQLILADETCFVAVRSAPGVA